MSNRNISNNYEHDSYLYDELHSFLYSFIDYNSFFEMRHMYGKEHICSEDEKNLLKFSGTYIKILFLTIKKLIKCKTLSCDDFIFLLNILYKNFEKIEKIQLFSSHRTSSSLILQKIEILEKISGNQKLSVNVNLYYDDIHHSLLTKIYEYSQLLSDEYFKHFPHESNLMYTTNQNF